MARYFPCFLAAQAVLAAQVPRGIRYSRWFRVFREGLAARHYLSPEGPVAHPLVQVGPSALGIPSGPVGPSILRAVQR